MEFKNIMENNPIFENNLINNLSICNSICSLFFNLIRIKHLFNISKNNNKIIS